MDIKVPEAAVLTEKEKSELTDKILTLKVLQTSAMELDTNVMHPFVRIHLVNMVTGTYIQKSDVAANAVYNFESNCVIEMRDDNKERKSCELELITAFATNCCDMR